MVTKVFRRPRFFLRPAFSPIYNRFVGPEERCLWPLRASAARHEGSLTISSPEPDLAEPQALRGPKEMSYLYDLYGNSQYDLHELYGNFRYDLYDKYDKFPRPNARFS